MRNWLYFVAISAASAVSVFAADICKTDTLSILVQAGPAFPWGSTLVGSSMTYDFTGTNHNLSTKSDQYLNPSQGAALAVGADYLFKDHLRAKALLEGTFSMPKPRVSTDSSWSWTDTATSKKVDTNDVRKVTYTSGTIGFSLIAEPSFTVADLFEMYLGVGAGVYLPIVSINSDNPNDRPDGYIKAWPETALIGEAGAYYPLNKDITLSAELSFRSMNFRVTETREARKGAPTVNYIPDNTSAASPYRLVGSSFGICVGAAYKVF